MIGIDAHYPISTCELGVAIRCPRDVHLVDHPLIDDKPIHEDASILVFFESDVAEFRRAQAELERERAAIAILKEVVGRS